MYDLDSLIAAPGILEALSASLASGAPPPLLRDVKIKITSRCNLRCRMCSYWKTRDEESLSTAEWKSVLDQLPERGCRKVHFSGGEVFLRRDFLDILEHSVRLGLKANLTTNGTLVDREGAERIVAARTNSVSISLDGPNARIHDAVRGVAGAFRKSLRTIRLLQHFSAKGRRPVKVRINFVVMRQNFRKLPEMVRLAGELGAVDLNPMPVDEKGARKNRLSRRQIELYNREIAPEVAEIRLRYGFSMLAEKIHPFGVTAEEIAFSRDGFYARGFFERQPCLAPWLHLFLAWDGAAYLCCMTNGRIEPLGNVRSGAVAEIFRGERFQAIRREFLAGRALPACHRCDLFLSENARLHAALGSRTTLAESA